MLFLCNATKDFVMNSLHWYTRRFFRPKIFDVRSYYAAHKYPEYKLTHKKYSRLFSFYLKHHQKQSSSFKFRSNKSFLFAGVLTWLGLNKEEEDPMISVMKLGILSFQKEEYDKAENILHLALKLAQERKDMQAQRYIFDLLANVAFKKKDFVKAEKLFIQVTKELIASGMPSDDNAIVEISLKLASIYSELNQPEKAEIGFLFCIDTQQRKLNDMNLSDPELFTEYEKDTVLLWAMSVDWFARFQLASGKYVDALKNFHKALDVSESVNGLSHPQTLVLLNDIGSVQSLLKDYTSAIESFQRAIDRSKESDSSDLPAFYCNLGAIYLQMGNVEKSEEACKTAVRLAKRVNNQEALTDAQECLREIKECKS